VRSRRLATVLFAGTLATILGMVLTGATRADVTPDPNWNEIFAPGLNTQSNTLCFDVPNGTSSRIRSWSGMSGGSGCPAIFFR
jgi:hypothetical protein